MADIEPISNDIPWSSRAALADALARVGHEDPVVVLRLCRPENGVQWSKANLSFGDLCALTTLLEAMRNTWAESLLES